MLQLLCKFNLHNDEIIARVGPYTVFESADKSLFIITTKQSNVTVSCCNRCNRLSIHNVPLPNATDSSIDVVVPSKSSFKGE